MTTYNTSSDSANTNVRELLTKVGEYYLGRSFNTAVSYYVLDLATAEKRYIVLNMPILKIG